VIAASIGVTLLASTASPQSTIKFCDLIRDSGKYNGKLVRVRATWIYGYEWSYLHCLDCEGKVWEDTSNIDEQSEKAIKHMPKYAGIVNVDVEGVFRAGGTFGHLNGYRYQLIVHAISNLVVLLNGMKPHEKELEIERKFACGGAKPR